MITAADIERLTRSMDRSRETEIFLGRAKLETFMRDRDRMDKAVRFDLHGEGDPIAELQKAWDDLRRWLDCIDPKTGLDAKRAMGIDPRGFDWDAMCGEWVGIA